MTSDFGKEKCTIDGQLVLYDVVKCQLCNVYVPPPIS